MDIVVGDENQDGDALVMGEKKNKMAASLNFISDTSHADKFPLTNTFFRVDFIIGHLLN